MHWRQGWQLQKPFPAQMIRLGRLRLAGGSSFLFRHRGGFRGFRRTGGGRFLDRITFCRFFHRDISAGTLSGGLLSSAGASDCGAGSFRSGVAGWSVCLVMAMLPRMTSSVAVMGMLVFQGEIARLPRLPDRQFRPAGTPRWGDFTDVGIRAAGVFLGGEFAPVRRGIGIQQGFASEHSVHSAVQGGIPLRFRWQSPLFPCPR